MIIQRRNGLTALAFKHLKLASKKNSYRQEVDRPGSGKYLLAHDAEQLPGNALPDFARASLIEMAIEFESVLVLFRCPQVRKCRHAIETKARTYFFAQISR